jgi:hypothetical protein
MPIVLNDRVSGWRIAINPSPAEWKALFPEGAGATLLADGTLVIGDGNELDHATIMQTAGFDPDIEDESSHRLQLYRDIAEVELWDDLDALFEENDIEDSDVTPDQVDAYTSFPFAARLEAAKRVHTATRALTGDLVIVTLRSSSCTGPNGDGIWQHERLDLDGLTLCDNEGNDISQPGHKL